MKVKVILTICCGQLYSVAVKATVYYKGRGHPTDLVDDSSHKVVPWAQYLYSQLSSSDQKLLCFRHVSLHGEYSSLTQQSFCQLESKDECCMMSSSRTLNRGRIFYYFYYSDLIFLTTYSATLLYVTSYTGLP